MQRKVIGVILWGLIATLAACASPSRPEQKQLPNGVLAPHPGETS